MYTICITALQGACLLDKDWLSVPNKEDYI